MFDATRAEFSDSARQAPRTRQVLRIFISSTAIDLTGYRDKVRDAVLRLENLPIAMETFSALGGPPASACMRMAAEGDAVVCIVAHRDGYVPPAELGGDGERSITWLEVDAAKRAGKPVFAFLVDPKAVWTDVKEEDRLAGEPDKTDEIFKAVQKLEEFKAYLGRECARQTFTSAEELAKLVAISLANATPRATARVWTPLFCHALQPAQHFRGRAAKLQELKDWVQSPVTPDRVLSVVAAGGTGKTALVNKALREATLSGRAGVFVWSFYEDSHTDAFLRAAYLYFTGEQDAPAGGMLERLQLALSGDAPHVLVLDGLERVQSEGDRARRGELEDLQLKRLMRALSGGVGNTRALATSRFPLTDLENWTGAGHRAITLDDLELPVALDVLRAWGVKGDDAALARLIEPLNIGGFYHALSIAVLGSYLGNFAGGDPNRAPKFSLSEVEDSDDPKARKLYRILEQYAKALTPVERDLLARLSLFPRGVQVELLGWIVQSGGAVAGALIGLSDRELVRVLERLRALGLVFRYEIDRQTGYSAHPFLREFFRNLLGTEAESVHESVRSRLAPSIEARPSKPPRDAAILDQYELLIEQTLMAGRIEGAVGLYWDGLGGYGNLGAVLGDNVRGLRIAERFVPRDDFSSIEAHLSLQGLGVLITALGLFAKGLGDLARARAALAHSQLLYERASKDNNGSIVAQRLAEVELLAGRFRQAFEHSCIALTLDAKGQNENGNSFARRAAANCGLGDNSAAVADFQRATELEGQALYSIHGIWEAECKLLGGDRTGALSQTQANREDCFRYDWNDDLCRSNALLARLVASEDPAQAAQHLQEARAFANRSGDVELQLRCFHAACELQRHLGDYPQSIAEGEAGILLADTCSFGKYSIDLRLALAETYLVAGDPRKALQNARNALDRSEEPDCQYAWGKADGLYFCGIAHLRLGERELARQRLTAALEIRERLGHGRVEETRRALEIWGRAD
jgi:tetratricopeptide (TPR) repeat protein